MLITIIPLVHDSQRFWLWFFGQNFQILHFRPEIWVFLLHFCKEICKFQNLGFSMIFDRFYVRIDSTLIAERLILMVKTLKFTLFSLFTEIVIVLDAFCQLTCCPILKLFPILFINLHIASKINRVVIFVSDLGSDLVWKLGILVRLGFDVRNFLKARAKWGVFFNERRV